MDLMGILTKVALVMTYLSLLAGFLITALTGSPRLVKIFLAVLAGISSLLAIILLVIFRAFIYLLFQYITVVLALCCVVIFGATLGYGFHVLIHRKPPGKNLKGEDLDDYLPAEDFAKLSGVETSRAIARVKSGFYHGGLVRGTWYISRTEMHSAPTDELKIETIKTNK